MLHTVRYPIAIYIVQKVGWVLPAFPIFVKPGLAPSPPSLNVVWIRPCFPYNQADSWQQLNYHTHFTATYSPLSGHEKAEKLEMILNICNFKKGKVKKLCKQVRDQIVAMETG